MFILVAARLSTHVYELRTSVGAASGAFESALRSRRFSSRGWSDGNEVDESISGSQFRFFCSAPRLGGFCEDLDISSLCVPFHLLDCIKAGAHRPIMSSFQTIFSQTFEASVSVAWITLSTSAGL